MKNTLIDILVCPTCLPSEIALKCVTDESDGGEIFKGTLTCAGCGRHYFIETGMAVLLPEVSGIPAVENLRYEAQSLVSSYFWSHYADLFADPESSDAYAAWARRLPDRPGAALDVGCAVGRFTFEMSESADLSIGVDRSRAFIRLARRLASERTVSFPLIVEGKLTVPQSITLPDRWSAEKVEFVVADALALPFRKEAFGRVASLNIIDKVPRPMDHLQEINRVAGHHDAALIFSAPYSWSTDFAPEDEWLGGTPDGLFAGSGRHNIFKLLQGYEGVVAPGWSIADEGEVRWKIRKHRNHYELITSEFIVANR